MMKRKLSRKEINRKSKFPDTRTFTWYNHNPYGKLTGDCVVRSLALAFGVSWEHMYRELASFSIERGLMLNDKQAYELFLAEKGYQKYKQPRKYNNKKYTGIEFCEQLANNKRIIAHIGGHHIVAIINNKIYDTWNCGFKCIGNYWVIE